MTQESKESPRKKRGAAALFIPAGLFLGLGIGWLAGYLVQGLFIGLGLGFLVFAVMLLTVRD